MSNERDPFESWKRDAIIAGGVGLLIAIAIGTVTFVMGHIGDTEARRLVEAILPTSRLFCSALMTVTSTILALMLTLIGISGGADVELTEGHYHRILKIGFYDAILFSVTAVMFVLHCVPVYESDQIPNWWYPTIYYGILIAASALAGGAVSIVMLLYFALKDLVNVIGFGDTDHRYAKGDCPEQKNDSQPADEIAEGAENASSDSA